MMLKPISTKTEHVAALAMIDALWGSEPDSDDGMVLDVLLDLVELYEMPEGEIIPPRRDQ